jgi:hypothetical protein
LITGASQVRIDLEIEPIGAAEIEDRSPLTISLTGLQSGSRDLEQLLDDHLAF